MAELVWESRNETLLGARPAKLSRLLDGVCVGVLAYEARRDTGTGNDERVRVLFLVEARLETIEAVSEFDRR